MELLKQRQVLHADETPVRQLDQGAGKTKRANLLSYRSNDLDSGSLMVVFDYRGSRSGQHARRKFFDLQVSGAHRSAAEALRRIGMLYSGLARAIDYSLNRWPSLIRYAQTGNLPTDNNPVENAIRPIAIGKKNRLFAGKSTLSRMTP